MQGLKRFGNYFLIKKIAAGGMAELYKAKKSGEKGFEKLLAIKMILPHLAASDEFISMFIDEAKVAALLDHQNIVQIYDLGKIEDSYCIVMEYVRGKDLRTVLSRGRKYGRPLSVEHACLIAAGTLAGLSYAHRKKDRGRELGIVHRDMSPQNILVSYEGGVKIVDFGIAKAATQSRDTQAGVLKGKLSYMSSEQALGKPLDMRSDVFSTGVVLYEALTGRRLFQGDTDIGTLELVRSAKVEPIPTSLDPSLPKALEEIVLKSLAREPGERYQSASEMEAALLGFMRDAGYSTSGYSLSEYMYGLFREDMEEEVREERDMDETQVSGTLYADTLAGQAATAGSARPAAGTAKTASPTPAQPSVRRKGSLAAIAGAVAVLMLCGIWLVPKLTGGDDAAETAPVDAMPAGVSAQPQPPAAVPEDVPSDVQPAKQAAALKPAPKPATEPVKPAPVAQAAAAVRPEPPDAKPPAIPAAKPPEKPDAKPAQPAPATAAITSIPPGARVFIDGSPAGVTPLKADGLAPGAEHRVRLVMAGYAVYEETISVREGGVARVGATLVRQYGALTVNAKPWAVVYIDDEERGTTPLAGIRLPAGEHQLVLTNPKLDIKKRVKVLIRPDDTTRVVIDLGK